MLKRWILLFWLLSPVVYVPLAINQFQLIEWAEIIFVSAFGNAFGASIQYLNVSLAGVRATRFATLLLWFATIGLTLTFTGLVTAASILLASMTGFRHGLGELLNFYAQLSLNFLIGGVTLVGASLPVLHSLFEQGKGETASTPQSSEESGGSQQDK